MQSSVLCGVRVNMMERRLLVAIGGRPQTGFVTEPPPQGSPDSTVQDGGGTGGGTEGRRGRSMCKWRDR